MSILKEALEWLKTNITKEPETVFHRQEQDLQSCYWHKGEMGWHRLHTESPPRSDVAHDLEAVLAFAEKQSHASVWYSREDVVAVYDWNSDLEDGRQRITMPLSFSPQVQFVQSLEPGGGELSQEKLVRTFQTVFRTQMAAKQETVGTFRRLKIRSGGEIDSDVQHGRRSMGKSLEAQVTGTGDIPEFLTLTIPIFEQFHFAQPIEFHIDPNPTTGGIHLTPVHGMMERSIQAAEKQIGDYLSDMAGEDFPVYFGAPDSKGFDEGDEGPF